MALIEQLWHNCLSLSDYINYYNYGTITN
jgi:hypothetical protein